MGFVWVKLLSGKLGNQGVAGSNPVRSIREKMAAETNKFEVTKHVLVPKHIKLSEEEAKKVLEKFNVKKKQLPRIKSTDAAIKHLDAKHGDLIRIERMSVTSGKTDFFRVVVNV